MGLAWQPEEVRTGGGGFAFRGGERWVLWSPREALLMEANAAAAEEFLRGRHEGDPVPAPVEAPAEFRPTRMTVSPSNTCGQACIYCYGTPAHHSRAVIDPGFCRAGADLLAANARAAGRPMEVHFHGLGEPTRPWGRFVECVQHVREAARAHGARCRIRLCTGGQLSAAQAEFVAAQCDAVDISMDGPPDIQRAHRPRRDGKDSFEPAMRTARTAYRAGRTLRIKATVTAASAGRMAEIVGFFGREIGPGIVVSLGDMEPLPWAAPERCRPAEAGVFMRGFEGAVAAGEAVGVQVQHPDISLQLLALPAGGRCTHLCLTPHNRLTAFYDVPREGAGAPERGAYGFYDAGTRTIRFDDEKRRKREAAPQETGIGQWLCQPGSHGTSGVRGQMVDAADARRRHCSIRIGLTQMLLRHALRRAS